MASKTDRAFNNWQEYEYQSSVHGGTGWYWERSDGLRLSMQTSGRYYPVGIGPRNGRGPRTIHWEDLAPGSNPAGGWGGWEDPVSLHEHVLCDMQTEHRGEHVRFAINNVLLGMVGRDEYPKCWIKPKGLSVEEIAKWAEKAWPIGTSSKWATLGVPAELS